MPTDAKYTLPSPSPAPHSRRVTVRAVERAGNRIAYDPGVGGGSADKRSVVVLLHALLQDRASLNPLVEAIGRRARVIVPEARGHGTSATLESRWYSVMELAEDVLAVLTHEGFGMVTVVGFDLGGATALEIARQAPETVRRLVLVEPALGSVLDHDLELAAKRSREARRSTDRSAADKAYKGLVDPSIDAYMEPRAGAGWRDALPRVRVAAIRRYGTALTGLLPALDGYAPTRDEIREIATETMVLRGAESPLLERMIAERLATLLPHGTLHEMNGAFAGGVGLNAETAAAIAAMVLGTGK